MPVYSCRPARESALPVLASLAILAVSPMATAQEGEAAAPARAPDALFSEPALPASELAATTGRAQSAWMTASTNNNAIVSDNHVGDNVVTGSVNVTDSAFQNVSGISMVNFNTGNSSSINAAMSVNLHINYAAPAAP